MLNPDVVVVGGGIIGCSSAYYLSRRGLHVVLLDQGASSNLQASSCDHGRVFRIIHGKDTFYADLALRTIPLWKELQHEAREELLLQNGLLEMGDGRHEETSARVLKQLGCPAQTFTSPEACDRYRILRKRAFKTAVFHADGGVVWAKKAIECFSRGAEKNGVRLESGSKVSKVFTSKGEVTGVKDAKGRLWKAKHYVFAAGAWTREVLSDVGIPLLVTRQECLYLRPPRNQGRYRPSHLPVFTVPSKGFYGLPVHIHGFMKVGDLRKGSVVRNLVPMDPDPKFELRVRKFLADFIPDLADFTDMEGKVYLFTRTPDGDFILDRLPKASNAWVAAGFSGSGPMFAPLVGQTVAQLVCGEKPAINLHRFRLGRLRLRGKA